MQYQYNTVIEQQKRDHVIIIGAGFAGLSAAYHMIRDGFRVTVVEASKEVGGLASSLLINGLPIERFYHFICWGDRDLIDLVYELGIGDKLKWRPAKTSYFYNHKMYEFTTPLDLLRFKPVPFVQRIRFGLNVIRSTYQKEWRNLDKQKAKSWLIDKVGRQAYEIMWDNLLRVKFGDFSEEISAAWIWHRIHRVAKSRQGMFKHISYGYLEKGCASVIKAVLDKLQQSDAFRLLPGVMVDRIVVKDSRVEGVYLSQTKEFIPAASVVSTVALPQFLKLLPLRSEYTDLLSSIKYLGVICMLLQLNKPLTNKFWVNINDPSISFNGIIEYTNLNPRRDLGENHFVYIPFYLSPVEERWTFVDEQLYTEYTTALKLLNPKFDASWVKNYWVTRVQYAQAVCTVGLADIMPSHETPIGGLYITDSTQYYPEDRTISAAIRLGRRVATLIKEKRATT